MLDLLINRHLSESARMLLGLRTAIYPVRDLATAKDWYTQVVGRSPYFDQPFTLGSLSVDSSLA
jgi:hypothetical protein